MATIIDDENEVVPLEAVQLQENMLDLQDRGKFPMWSEATVAAGHPARMPNPDRALSEGEPLYTSFIDRNLPRKLLQQDSHIHFISTSPPCKRSRAVPDFQGAYSSSICAEHSILNDINSLACHAVLKTLSAM
jgi:hypothetical protein